MLSNELYDTISQELPRLAEGTWVRTNSKIPWLSDGLVQRVSYLHQPEKDMTEGFLEEERNALAEIAAAEAALDAIFDPTR